MVSGQAPSVKGTLTLISPHVTTAVFRQEVCVCVFFCFFISVLRLSLQKHHQHTHLLVGNPSDNLLLCSHIGSFGHYPQLLREGSEKLWRMSGATFLDICILFPPPLGRMSGNDPELSASLKAAEFIKVTFICTQLKAAL